MHRELPLNPQIVADLYACTNQFAARLRAGLTSTDVREALTAVLIIEGHADLLGSDYGMTKALLTGPVRSLQELAKIWSNSTAISCPRIAPIGLPTLSGTFKGLAISSMFNAAFSLLESVIDDSRTAALNHHIHRASKVVLLAREVCVQRLRK